MKTIVIRPILKQILLTDYAAEAVGDDGQPFAVWVRVNPPRLVREQYDAINARNAEILDAWNMATAAFNHAAEAADKEAALAEQTAALEKLRGTSAEFAEWYAQLWSQHSDPATHWTAADVLALEKHDTDPGLSMWLFRETWRLLNEHRSGEQKKPAPRSPA